MTEGEIRQAVAETALEMLKAHVDGSQCLEDFEADVRRLTGLYHAWELVESPQLPQPEEGGKAAWWEDWKAQ